MHNFVKFITHYVKSISLPRLSKLTIVFTSALLAACSQQEAATPKAIAPGVTVYSVKNIELGGHREFVARTVPFQEANITARVEGQLVKRHFEEGRFVEKNQLLFEIEADSYQASLTQAKADLEGKHSVLETAKRNLARGQEVAPQGFISQSDLDKLITEDLQAKAAVSSALAALEKAELNLSYTQIKAPFSGRIGRVNVNTGNVVGPTSGTLATITANDPMYVSFQIEEAEVVSYMQKNMSKQSRNETPVDVSLKLPNNTMYDQMGVLEYADTKISESTGTIDMRAEFKNPDGIILPGLFVTLMIDGQDKKPQITVPQMAVQENQQGKFVLVVDEQNTVAVRPVSLGRRINAMWVVESGLVADERIIIQGLQKVRAGIAVKPTEKNVDAKTGAVQDLVN
ncbi:efflux RND transporter periplasmic adaptor subunit [Thalassotalea atypica]|uniref:efflux RND transporter periplasmic adaptor subunit n=1 Tax=Thalassotalea atypica TaxID=2054316 RepID=UPI0025748FA6|nr:efflux RND transporter periplasmic adaptor subunit [Thalassotalea atypica]